MAENVITTVDPRTGEVLAEYPAFDDAAGRDGHRERLHGGRVVGGHPAGQAPGTAARAGRDAARRARRVRRADHRRDGQTDHRSGRRGGEIRGHRRLLPRPRRRDPRRRTRLHRRGESLGGLRTARRDLRGDAVELPVLAGHARRHPHPRRRQRDPAQALPERHRQRAGNPAAGGAGRVPPGLAHHPGRRRTRRPRGSASRSSPTTGSPRSPSPAATGPAPPSAPPPAARSRRPSSNSADPTRSSSSTTPTCDAAATAAVRARFHNTGQSCVCAKRFLVADPVADEFTRLFVEKTRALVVGDPTDPATQVGPMARADLRDQLHDPGRNARSPRAPPCSPAATRSTGPAPTTSPPSSPTPAGHRGVRRGNLRPGRRARHREFGRRARRAGQRQRVRPRAVHLDRGHRPGRAAGTLHHLRGGVRQRRGRLRPAPAVRRHQTQRPRPRTRRRRHPRVHHHPHLLDHYPGHRPGRRTGTGAPGLTERAKLEIDLPRPRSIADTDAWTTDDLGEL